MLGVGYAEDRIAKQLTSDIEADLVRLGLLVRVFGRVKSAPSLEAKFGRTDSQYSPTGKRLQDLFGIRVTLYFADDLEIAQTVLKRRYTFDSASVSPPSNDSFGPNRCNLIFRLPVELASQCTAIKLDPRIDDAFEVQFRTVLSEGWHEVEHDLRYKRKADWASQADLYRSLNGVMATLETCDWTMMQIFSELSWRSFKKLDISAMLHTKFRLRLSGQPISETPVYEFLRNNGQVVRKLYRLDRAVLLERLLEFDGELPLNELNLVLFANRAFAISDELQRFEPRQIKQLFERTFPQANGNER
jgi:ppGpp synthetase/RelA/SpoT-type nucleotidyltranferase